MEENTSTNETTEEPPPATSPPSQTIELCSTNSQGLRTCIEQQQGIVVWGSDAGTWQEGFGLVLVAFLAGFSIALVKRTFLDV